MLPTLTKLADDVAKIIKTPSQEAIKMASTEAIKAGGKAATSLITSSIEVQKKLLISKVAILPTAMMLRPHVRSLIFSTMAC